MWVWHKLQHLSWHWKGRALLGVLLGDQAEIPFDFLPGIAHDPTLVILLVTLIFAPIPTVKKDP